MHRALWWCLVALVWWPGQLVAQQAHDLPVVTVSFDLSTAPLYQNLPDKDRVAQEITSYLTEQARQEGAFGFVRWHTASDASVQADEVKAALTLQMVQLDTSFDGGIASEIILRFSAKTVEGPLPDFKIEQTLYGLGDLEKHQHNPDKLKRTIQSKIDAWFEAAGAETFQNALMNGFLKKVPLSESVQVDEDNSLLIIPLRAQGQESLNQTSVLRATFRAKKDNGQALDGEFTARVLPGGFPLTPSERVLYCMVQTFFYPHAFFHDAPLLMLEGLSPQDLHATFGRDIKEILEARREGLTVYMEAYRTSLSSPSGTGTLAATQ